MFLFFQGFQHETYFSLKKISAYYFVLIFHETFFACKQQKLILTLMIKLYLKMDGSLGI